MFVMSNAKYFQHNQLMYVRERLIATDESKWVYVQTLQLKDPTISLIISILVGALGIDRFLIGDTGLGIAKLLTCGGLGIWALVDWFLIMGRTKEKNFRIEFYNEIISSNFDGAAPPTPSRSLNSNMDCVPDTFSVKTTFTVVINSLSLGSTVSFLQPTIESISINARVRYRFFFLIVFF